MRQLLLALIQDSTATDGKDPPQTPGWSWAQLWKDIVEDPERLAWAGGIIVAGVLAGLIVHFIIFRALARFAKRDTSIDNTFVKRLRRPSRIILPLLGVLALLPNLGSLTTVELAFLKHAVTLIAIFAIAWMLIAVTKAIAEQVMRRHDVSVADNLEARRVHTQISVLSRTVMVFIIIIAVAAALMTFPRIRQLGTTILVSAGFAGLAIGLAARPVLENLIAGLQIAFTQPIRLDDVVIIDGEWGRIEEITTTYVVVKIWDERRLIVPFSKFISNSFQNWTRTSADILGTVMIYADYRVPVEAVRAELKRIVERAPQWDKRICNVQVTDASEQTMHLRALMSASNSSKAWELRVHVREKLIEFLQREYPECLPRTRVELASYNQEMKNGRRTSEEVEAAAS